MSVICFIQYLLLENFFTEYSIKLFNRECIKESMCIISVFPVSKIRNCWSKNGFKKLL